MTHAMPRTKPNIMITARLLLMPVLRSVELNVVDCASAGRVLRAKTAAATRSDGNRERTLGLICLIIFMRVNDFVFLSLPAVLPLNYATTISQAHEAVVYVIHKMRVQSL